MSYNEVVYQIYDLVLKTSSPLRFIIIEADGTISHLPSVIQEFPNLNELQKRFPKVNPIDLVMLYYLLTYESSENKTPELLQQVKLAIDTFYTDIDLRLILNLEQEYESWSAKISDEINRDRSYADDYINSYNILSNINLAEIKYSPINYTFVNRITKPLRRVMTPNGEVLQFPTIDDGLDIFDFARPSYNVPFIQYNKNSNDLGDLDNELDLGNRYKIYKGDTNNPIPPELIVLGKAETKNKDTLYLTVWIGKSFNKLVKDYYIPVSYDLSSGILEFSVPLKEQDTADLIISRLEESLGIIVNKDEITNLNVGAEFMIYNNTIDHHIFSYAVLNDSVFDTFFYIDEKTKTSALKKVHRLRYKNILEYITTNDPLVSSAWLTFHNIETSSIELFPVISEDTVENIQLSAGGNYIKVSIVKADNKLVADEVYQIFIRLTKLYLDLELEYKHKLNDIFYFTPLELFQESISSPEEIPSKKKRSDRNIFTLKELGKGLIDNHYAKSCQCPRQPIIIQQEEIPEWSDKTFISRGLPRVRQIMPFPPDNPKWWFVCIKDQYPFPGIRINKEQDVTGYPYIPCCFKSDQMVEHSGNLYDYYYNKNPLKVTSKKNGDILASNKTLSSQRLGELPDTVIKLLNRYNESDDTTYYRYGVPISKNSLLHCVFEALQYPAYISLTTDEDKEDLVKRYRQFVFDPSYESRKVPAGDIAGLTAAKDRFTNRINATKQELYDFTDDEIKSLLVDPNVFLDPALYYRFIEDLFGINLFVFGTSKNNEETFATLETPRHKLFHTRFYHKNRDTVVIYKYWPQEVEHPQCELIVMRDINTRDILERLYHVEMAELLYDIIIKTKNTISWSIDPNNLRITARKNLFDSISSYQIFINQGFKVVSQFLDGYGKARGFIILDGNREIPIIVPPTQPENLPVKLKLENVPTIEEAYRLFGNDVTFVSLNSAGLIDGLWYKILDLEEGFYIPIQGINRSALVHVPVGSTNPLFTDGKNIIRRTKELRKIHKVILQFVSWLFLNSRMSLIDFAEKYIKINVSPIKDSYGFYDTSRVLRRFPVINNFEEALRYSERVIPSLVQQNKIIMYTKKYAEGVIYYLKEYLKSLDDTKPVEIPRDIKGTFLEESDFKQFNNTVIFVNETDMRTWLYSKTHMTIKTSTIRKKIDFSDNSNTEPFLYQDPSGKFYIIQNVINSDFKRAINVAYSWYTNKVNLGYDSEMWSGSTIGAVPRNVIYGITAGNIPEPIKDNREGDPNFLQLLNYGNTQYAAMLPL